MESGKRLVATILLCAALAGCSTAAVRKPASASPLRGDALDSEVERLMREAHVPGLALAVIEDGRIVHLKAYGWRDTEKRLPLTTDTVMYGASLTKGTFAYAVMSLVESGKLDLDRSIADYLPKPLPEYEKYADLAGDERWRKLTPRILLSHTWASPTSASSRRKVTTRTANSSSISNPAAASPIPAKASTCCSS